MKNPQCHGHRYRGSAILFPFLLLSCSLGDLEMDTVLKRLKLEDLTEKFQTKHITPDIVCKLSVHEMEMLGINSRSDMMSLRIECTKFGGEAPKKLEGTCGAPIFFIPQSVLGDLLQEGFTIKEISSILAVSESTVYRRMRQTD